MKITFGFLLLWLPSVSQGYSGSFKTARLVLPKHNRSCSRWSRISQSFVVLPFWAVKLWFFWPCKGKWFQISWVLCGISHLCCSSAALSSFRASQTCYEELSDWLDLEPFINYSPASQRSPSPIVAVVRGLPVSCFHSICSRNWVLTRPWTFCPK